MNTIGGATIFVILMLGIVIIFLALNLAYPLNQVTTDSRIQMNCSNSTLEYQDKANCVAVDSFNFLLFGITLGLAGYIMWRAFV